MKPSTLKQVSCRKANTVGKNIKNFVFVALLSSLMALFTLIGARLQNSYSNLNSPKCCRRLFLENSILTLTRHYDVAVMLLLTNFSICQSGLVFCSLQNLTDNHHNNTPSEQKPIYSISANNGKKSFITIRKIHSGAAT